VSRLDDLLRGEVAYAAMRSIIRDLVPQSRNLRKDLPAWAVPVLEALAAAAGEPVPAGVRSVIGRAPAIVELVDWITVKEASGRSGKSERHIRRLAASGRVRNKRVGERSWLIDSDSLINVLRRTA
jgi:hypothetical protein